MDATRPGLPEGGQALLRIGEVAERLGLSLRTIRFYEEEGLVAPETRTGGGFRLYGPAAVARLELITRLKPLGFSVTEMAEVLGALDAVADPSTPPAARREAVARLEEVRERVEARSATLLTQAARGQELARHLREVTRQHR